MPMTWLSAYGPSNLEALLILLAFAALAAAGYWLLRRRWGFRMRTLHSALGEAQRAGELFQAELDEARRQRALDEARHGRALDEVSARHDPTRIRALQEHLQRVIAHEFLRGLHFIISQDQETLTGLRADQPDLRERQNQALAKAYELDRHARNVVQLAELEWNAPQRELVNLRALLEEVLAETFSFAEARGVHLRTQFGSLAPISVNRLLAAGLYANVVHNAIKYSFPGSAVDIVLRLECEGARQAVVDVCDRGRGIEARDQERIFELNVRGDGQVEPGSGLGLYYARKIARLHGGDLLLVESKLNGGSTFRVILPYAADGDASPSAVTAQGEAL